MSKELKAIGTYSLIRNVADTYYVSGQLGLDPETGELVKGFKGQCEQVLKNLQVILESEGLTFDDVLKLTVFMTDLEDFGQVNEIFEKYLSEPYPARSAFEVVRLPKDALVKIEAIAVKV